MCVESILIRYIKKKKNPDILLCLGKFLFLKNTLEVLKAGRRGGGHGMVLWASCGFCSAPRPMRCTSGPLLSWPAQLELRGAQARLGVPPEQTQPLHRPKETALGQY